MAVEESLFNIRELDDQFTEAISNGSPADCHSVVVSNKWPQIRRHFYYDAHSLMYVSISLAIICKPNFLSVSNLGIPVSRSQPESS